MKLIMTLEKTVQDRLISIRKEIDCGAMDANWNPDTCLLSIYNDLRMHLGLTNSLPEDKSTK